VLVVLAGVLGLGFYQQWQAIGRLPSRYDTGLTLDKAFKQSPTPLLVEFYSDSCGTCQRVTPIIHETANQFKGKLTLVMVDTNNPDNATFAQLFGVKTIPRVFVFDPRKMKKHTVPDQSLASTGDLKKALLPLI
jgi:thiol-disulfide isomerase/thioredoxin